MITGNEVKKGSLLLIDDEPYSVIDVAVQSPSARASATLIKTKVKNIRSKQILQKTFKASDRIEVPNFEIIPCQFLYHENETLYYFMHVDNYEQHAIAREDIEYELQFIKENDILRLYLHDHSPIGLELPNTVNLRVVETEPAVKGDTVTSTTKSARLETGLVLQVPLFVEEDSILVVDTRDARYIRRA